MNQSDRNYLGRLKTFGAASVPVGTARRVQLSPGERPYFLSAMGDALGGVVGTITFENTTWTINPGSALTVSGESWPEDCSSYHQFREVSFNATLGPIIFMWGPVCR